MLSDSLAHLGCPVPCVTFTGLVLYHLGFPKCAKPSLVLVGPQLPKKINALASYRDYTFAAYGTNIAVFHRCNSRSSHNDKVKLLLLFGDHIVSINTQGNLFLWELKGMKDNQLVVLLCIQIITLIRSIYFSFFMYKIH